MYIRITWGASFKTPNAWIPFPPIKLECLRVGARHQEFLKISPGDSNMQQTLGTNKVEFLRKLMAETQTRTNEEKRTRLPYLETLGPNIGMCFLLKWSVNMH